MEVRKRQYARQLVPLPMYCAGRRQALFPEERSIAAQGCAGASSCLRAIERGSGTRHLAYKRTEGPGSHDYSITDVDVPVEFSFDFFLDRPTRSEALYRLPALSVLMGSVAAVPVGIARAAVDAFKKFARIKVALPSSAPISESPIVQADLARAETAARSSRLLLFSAMEDLWQTVRAQRTVSTEQRNAPSSWLRERRSGGGSGG